jgi:hypothetical protein
MTVKLKFWTMIVTTPQLHVNNCYLSLSFYYWALNEYSKSAVLWQKNKVRRGYSKYGLHMNIFYRNLCPFTTQRNVTWWSHDTMVGWPEIWDLQSTENNKIWSDGLNGVWGGNGLHLRDEDKCRQGAEIGWHSFIRFRQKLRPESSYLCNSDIIWNTARQRQECMALWGLERDSPPDLEHAAKHFKTWKSAFQRKGDK